MTINMRIMTKRVISNYKKCKHKRCKTQTTRIKIITTKRVTSNDNQKGH